MHCALFLAASDMQFIDSNSEYSLLVEIRTGHSMTLRPFALAAGAVALGVIIFIFLGENEALFFQIPTGHSMTLPPFALAADAVALGVVIFVFLGKHKHVTLLDNKKYIGKNILLGAL